MSVNLQTHLGPYLQVSTKLTKPVTTVKRQCPSHPNRKQDNNKYCPICGAEVLNVDDIKQVNVMPMDIIGWDRLSPAHEMKDILLPQTSVPNNIDFDIENCNVVINLLGINKIMVEQVEWFKTKFANEIQALGEAFGPENIHVKWGVVSYWS
jgi:hypothetical protein